MQKGIFKSKIFWVAAVSFLLSVVQLLTGKEVPAGTAEQIVGIDWTNIVQAILSLLVIVFRVFFSGTTIGGLFGGRLLS
ncbi:MAG: phage holin [Bacteroidetes bacterium]|nr:phage holin [Bacteroidota bacterium]